MSPLTSPKHAHSADLARQSIRASAGQISRPEPGEQAQPEKIEKKKGFGKEKQSVWTLAECERRAAAAGQKPLRLPRADPTTS